ncbi:MAG: hypothetical protein Q9157_005501 [Trypethelium eluteriae]
MGRTNDPLTDNRTRCKEVLEGYSSHHQLQCGHFMIATWIERCAQNCAKPKTSTALDLADNAEEAEEDVTTEAFVCPTCLDRTTMSMFLEKRQQYQEVEYMDDPRARYIYLIYMDEVEKQMKELREEALQAGRRCREVPLQGECGEQALSRREQMLAEFRGSIRGRREDTAHVRQDRSRSPARDTEGESPRDFRSRRDLSPRGATLLEASRKVTPIQIEYDLIGKMRALDIGYEAADHLAAKLCDLRLEEDTQAEAQQERQLKEHNRRAESSRQSSKDKTERDFRETWEAVREGAERAAQQPSTSESRKNRHMDGKAKFPNAQSVGKISGSAKSPYVRSKPPVSARGTMLMQRLGERSQEPSSRGSSPESPTRGEEEVGERPQRRQVYFFNPSMQEMSDQFEELSADERSDDDESLQENEDYPDSEDAEDWKDHDEAYENWEDPDEAYEDWEDPDEAYED